MEQPASREQKNPRVIEKCVFQDEKDFSLEVPINQENNGVYMSNRQICTKSSFQVYQLIGNFV